MELISFRVLNFRSIPDSGTINVGSMTALVGRNESGKSNLLLALQSLNPPGGRQPLSPIKDFPRDRRLSECTDETEVVVGTWRLSTAERDAVAAILGADNEVSEVDIGRRYDGTLFTSLSGVVAPTIGESEVKSALRRLAPILAATSEKAATEHRTALSAAVAWLVAACSDVSEPNAWAAAVKKSAAALRAAFAAAAVMLDEAPDELLATVEAKAAVISAHDGNVAMVEALVESRLPLFVYVADFPELDGQQDIDSYQNRRAQGLAMTPAESNFEKLAKVADFDPKQLQALRASNDHETRNQLLNRSGALVTKEMRRLWKDRSLKVRFNIDGPQLDTLISDPNASYDVEVNLNERSRGFRWFFSFYMTFAADTQGGTASGAILLLDEPGLYLHAKSQEDLLRHFKHDFPNQIVYTTHSPFMIPPDDIGIVRTVNITQDGGTQVTNDPTGDTRTLFPLQAALGYNIAQSLFLGPANLVLEGITDFWILSSVNAYFKSKGRTLLPDDMALTPVGGAGKIPYMVALLSAQELSVLVLLDDENAGRATQKDIVTNRIVAESSVILVSEAFEERREADVEDLIDPAVYERLARHVYAKDLKGKKLVLNDKVPRIAKRLELAFQAIDVPFNKTRPAREFLERMTKAPDDGLNEASLASFERLFGVVSDRYERGRKTKAA